jgi:23S rRNA pseudouridine1911/1915/1917 synthase
MTPLSVDILLEDNHCIAVAKPAGIASTHYQGREATIDRQIKGYLKHKYHKPGNVFLGVVHRLDRLVSGVLLFARTSKAADRIAKQFRDGTVRKVYWAIMEGQLSARDGTFEDWLIKDTNTGKVTVVNPITPGARRAVLTYRVRASHGSLTFLEIHPKTGRTHQIRVQLAERGCPVFGDRKYGSRRSFGNAIALHARSLTFAHPIRNEPITLTANVPVKWQNTFGSLLGEATK